MMTHLSDACVTFLIVMCDFVPAQSLYSAQGGVHLGDTPPLGIPPSSALLIIKDCHDVSRHSNSVNPPANPNPKVASLPLTLANPDEP